MLQMLFGSIVAVVVTMYATQFSPDLFGPGLSSTNIPPLAPTGTPTPTETPTSTPTPTDTPTPAISPTATVTAFGAPVLLEPEEGILFGPADSIVLAWRWYHRSKPRDAFSVGLLREGEEPMTPAWLGETQLTVDMQNFTRGNRPPNDPVCPQGILVLPLNTAPLLRDNEGGSDIPQAD
jgi:hypothetical protein